MKPNVILKAPLYDQSGYANHAREVLAMLSTKCNVQAIPLSGWGRHTDAILDQNTSDLISYSTANQINSKYIYIHLTVPHEFDIPKDSRSITSIGYTAGLETDRVSKLWVASCNKMNSIITVSSHSKKTLIDSGVTVPVTVIPEAIGISSDTTPIDLPDDLPPFNFLFTGQWGLGGADRKNLSKLIQTFIETFKDNPDVGLILKTYSSNNSTVDKYQTLQRLTAATRGSRKCKITLIHGDLTTAQLSQLYCDPRVKCYVTFSHGEGFNRPALDAASVGLPVIAPNWSGHIDFLHPQLLLPYTMVNLPREATWGEYITSDMKWCMVDNISASIAMKSVVSSYDKYKQVAVDHSNLVVSKYSTDFISKELLSIVNKYWSASQTSLISISVDR